MQSTAQKTTPRRSVHDDARRARLVGRGWRFVRFHTPVRGYRFAGRPPGSGHPRPGQAVGLLRERDHPVDLWAVGVWVRSEDGTPWRIGYLERAVAARIAPHLDEGARPHARIAGWGEEPHGRWRRPVIVVEPDLGRGRVRQSGVTDRPG